MDANRILVLVHMLYRATEVKAPHATLHRRLSSMTASGSVSPLNLPPALGKSKQQKKDYSQVLQSYFAFLAAKISTFSEAEIPEGTLVDEQTLQFFIENLSAKRIKTLVLNRSNDVVLALLESPAASASGSHSNRDSGNFGRSNSLNDKPAPLVHSGSASALSTSGSSSGSGSAVQPASGRAVLERARASSRPQSLVATTPPPSSSPPISSRTGGLEKEKLLGSDQVRECAAKCCAKDGVLTLLVGRVGFSV